MTVICQPHTDVMRAIAQSGGVHLAARLAALDAPGDTGRGTGHVSSQGPGPNESCDYDVLVMGGGLSMLLAVTLARAGVRVALCDSGQIAQGHREWNASYGELQALVQAGVCDESDLAALIVNRYDHGVCRWFGGTSHRVKGVLDCAVDATQLLAHLRRRVTQDGVTLLPQCEAREVWPSAHGVRVALHQAGGKAHMCTARVVIDGRGVKSPYARHDLLCPTVGGVVEGLEEGLGDDLVQPNVGEILVTTENVEEGRQHLWEVFPGRGGQYTIYLFYYARAQDVRPGALQALYERFFARMPAFKRGRAALVRPTFGYIPGWSRLCRGAHSSHRRVMLVGDAAARQSPLTFCGFGAMLRSLQPVTATALLRLNDASGDVDPYDDDCVADDRALHSATGGLAMLVARAHRLPANALNRVLDAAFATLAHMGNDTYRAMLQDTMSLDEFVRFMQRVSYRYPAVYPLAWHGLGTRNTATWARNLWCAYRAERVGSRRRAAFALTTTEGPQNSP